MGFDDAWDWVEEKVIDPVVEVVTFGLVDDFTESGVYEFASDVVTFPFTWGLGDNIQDAVDELRGKPEEEAARALANLNAEFIVREYEETRRRAELEFGQMMSYIEGVQATSGLSKHSDSFEAYRAETRQAFDEELKWMEQSAESRAQIAIAGGEVAAEQAKWGVLQGWFNIGSTTASFFL